MSHDLAQTLRAEGLVVLEYQGWRTRGRAGAFTPIGVCNHHTASRRDRGEFPSLNTVVNGRQDIPGPLCNLLVGRGTGRVYIISANRANDTGNGSSVVLNEVRQNIAPRADAGARGLSDDVNGNPFFYDVEVENDGVGEPYHDHVIESVIKINTALCRHHGWHPNRCIQHREWTKRKIDMSWRGNLRGLVSQRLAEVKPKPEPEFDPNKEAEVGDKQEIHIVEDDNPATQDQWLVFWSEQHNWFRKRGFSTGEQANGAVALYGAVKRTTVAFLAMIPDA